MSDIIESDAQKERNLIEQIQDLQERMIQLEAHALTSQDIIASSLSITGSGDISSVPWTDYSSTFLAESHGWVSVTGVYLYYKKIGKTVYVTFHITGTSNAATTTLPLPFAANASAHSYQVITRIKDAGTYAVGFLNLNSGASTVSFFKSALSDVDNDWATSGIKGIYGQFVYEAA